MNPVFNGADKKIRTSDLRITNAPLYQLSYIGSGGRQVYSNQHSATTSLWLNICLRVFQVLLTSFRTTLSYRPCPRIRRMFPHQQHVDHGGRKSCLYFRHIREIVGRAPIDSSPGVPGSVCWKFSLRARYSPWVWRASRPCC